MILWGGRFKEKPDRKIIEFTSSIEFDRVLAEYELKINRVWVSMLNRINIITAGEKLKFFKAFDRIEDEIKKNKFEFNGFEDIHSAIDDRLNKILGSSLAGKLTTGRSRNDMIATEFRMYLKDKILYIKGLIKGLQKRILEKVQIEKDKIMPGFTHLQVAMPVSVGHYLLSYFWMFNRDRKNFSSAFEDTDRLPLGSGSLAGTSIDIDREFLRVELNFKEVIPNSMDAVSDRDFVLKYLFSVMTLYLHLSRFSEEMIIFTSNPFSFVEIEDRFTTGSSLMPQKKNPDFFELIRGKSAKSIGILTGMAGVLKGLPLTYNRDLQEDKKDVFIITDEVIKILELMGQVISTIKFNEIKMRRTLKKGFAQATQLAEYLAKKGVPFRKTHHIVGNIIVYCERKGKDIEELTLEELKDFDSNFDSDVYPVLSVEKSIELLNTEGSPNSINLFHQIKKAYKVIEEE